MKPHASPYATTPPATYGARSISGSFIPRCTGFNMGFNIVVSKRSNLELFSASPVFRASCIASFAGALVNLTNPSADSVIIRPDWCRLGSSSSTNDSNSARTLSSTDLTTWACQRATSSALPLNLRSMLSFVRRLSVSALWDCNPASDDASQTASSSFSLAHELKFS